MGLDLNRGVKAFADRLRGLRCWYVCVGGCTLPTFSLAFGEKLRRPRPLRNPAVSDEYRVFEGEFGLLVWCTWRLDAPAGPITSSDDSEARICEGLERLVDARVRTASVTGLGRDLRMTFNNRLVLSAFCDHVAPDADSDYNWYMWGQGQELAITAGSRVEFGKGRAKPAAEAEPTRARA